jgi:hypothetical protein
VALPSIGAFLFLLVALGPRSRSMILDRGTSSDRFGRRLGIYPAWREQ